MTGEGNLAEIDVKVRKIIPHPDYEPEPTLYNDIAILYLAQEIDLATYTPACLPSKEDTTAYDGRMALAVGNFMA